MFSFCYIQLYNIFIIISIVFTILNILIITII